MILKFEFSVDETNFLLAVLGKQPLEVSLALWSKIKQSAEAQMAQPKAAEPKAAE